MKITDMKTVKRHKEIIDLLNTHGTVSVASLASGLDVSRETVRRDLSYLAKQDKIRKVHGGAVPLQTGYEMALEKRELDMRSEKVTACKKVIGLIKPNDSLFIDSGTTTMLLAQLLCQHESLKIITNSSQIAEVTAKHNQTFLLGGWFSELKAGNFGNFVIEQAKNFHTDHAFLSIGSIHLNDGFANFTEEEAMIARVMHQQSKQTTVIADHSKLSKRALVKVCDLDEIDYVAIDTELPQDYADAFKRANIEVL